MKKKQPVRILLVLLCMTMLCSIPVYAAETRASDRIYRSAVSLSPKSNGDLSVYFSVQATGIMEKIGASSVVIQRSYGNGWVTEYTFNTSNTPALLVENSDWHGADVFTALYRDEVPHCGDDLCEGCGGDEYTATDESDDANRKPKSNFEFILNY